MLFEGRRQSVSSLLEVRVGGANLREGSNVFIREGSSRAWRDYFAVGNAHIVSLDTSIDSDVNLLSEERIHMLSWDATEKEVAEKLHNGFGLFDIVIDDGHQSSKHQQTTLNNLWSLVRPGGIYVIEDMQWWEGKVFPLLHGDAADSGILEIVSVGEPAKGVVSVSQSMLGASSHSNLVVLSKPLGEERSKSEQAGHDADVDGWEVLGQCVKDVDPHCLFDAFNAFLA